jgi:hypothetical protein
MNFETHTTAEIISVLKQILDSLRYLKRRGARGIPKDEEIMEATIAFFEQQEK